MTTNNRRRRWWWQNTALCKHYARGLAVVFLLLGLVGTTTTLVSWAGSSTLYYFALALLFGYAGFFVEDRETVRQMIEGLGVLLVVVQGISWSSLLVLGVPIGWGAGRIRRIRELLCGSLEHLGAQVL